MTSRTTDRLTWAVLAIAFLLLIAALVGLIVWADVQIQRYERRAVDAEAELADARKETLMWQGAMRGLVEGSGSTK
jgi:hypothetical protein